MGAVHDNTNPNYQPFEVSGTVTPDSTEATELAQLNAVASQDTLSPVDRQVLRESAFQLMPLLSAPDQAKLVQFIQNLQAQFSTSSGSSTSGVLLTQPPTQNPYEGGVNITLVMQILFQILTKMGNNTVLAMNKSTVAQMNAKLQAAIQVASLTQTSANLDAQMSLADAASKETAATTALAQAIIGSVVMAVTVAVQLGAVTRTDQYAGYGDTDTAEGQRDDAIANQEGSRFGNAKYQGGQTAIQYSDYTRAREQDLMAFNKVMDWMNSTSQSLGNYITNTAQANADIATANLKTQKGTVDALNGMLQSLMQTLDKGIDTTSQARDSVKDMLQNLKQLVMEIFQTATKFYGSA